MGYIKEPKNIDLVVGPSVLTDESKKRIAQVIAQYKKSGQKATNIAFVTQGSVQVSTHIGRAQAKKQNTVAVRRKAKPSFD